METSNMSPSSTTAHSFFAMARTILALFLVIFLLIPFASERPVKGEKSTPFWDVFGIGSKLNTWLAKNPDINDRISRLVKWRVFHISPSTSIHIGKDGWLFYALDHNLDIARGTFPITEKVMADTASALKRLKTHYDKLGATLFYLPVPSQTSIYPEFIYGESLSVGISPVDQIVDYVTRHTDINVIPTKQQLLEDKKIDYVYRKKDVHQNEFGLYSIYKSICQSIKQATGIGIAPIHVDFVPGEYALGMNSIAKIPNIFGVSETMPVAEYTPHARPVSKGELYDRILSIYTSGQYGKPQIRIYTNPEAPIDKTLLIYGYSTFDQENIGESGGQLLRFLAENFRTVVLDRGLMVNYELDTVVRPDIVIIENAERYLSANRIKTIIHSALVSTPVVTESQPAFGYIDKLATEKTNIVISGWIAVKGIDCTNQQVFVSFTNNDTKQSVTYTAEKVTRAGVAEVYKNKLYTESGYHAVINKTAIPDGKYSVAVIVQHGDKTWQYPPRNISILHGQIQ